MSAFEKNNRTFNKISDYSGDTIQISKQGYLERLGAKGEDGKNIFWTADVDTELPVRMPATGISS